jgi:Ca-activated chloride channel family protein
MSFSHPWLLLLLLLPLVMLVRGWRRHGREIVVPYDHSSPRRRRLLTLTLRIASTLPALLLAISIVLLAGPQRFGEPRTRRILTNIEFLVDVSGSMTSKYGDGNRYDAAMASIMKFIDYRKGDAFGLSVFGTDVLHWVPLTTDPSAMKCAPQFLAPMRLPRWFGGGTMIGMGLQSCMDSLVTRADGDRMIILLTDGYSFDLANGNDEVIGKKLRDAGITVHCIHIDESAPPPEVQMISSLTGGQTFPAGDPAALPLVFQSIDRMQKARTEKVSGETVDDFQPWVMAGGCVVLLAVLAGLGLRYTPW